MKIIQEHIDELLSLCKRYHVDELYAFGSVVSGKFTSKSDIDLLVRFYGVQSLEYFDNYIDFKLDLEGLYSRKVDLVEMQAIKNPILSG